MLGFLFRRRTAIFDKINADEGSNIARSSNGLVEAKRIGKVGKYFRFKVSS